MKSRVLKYIIAFGLGAVIYGDIEIVARGYTHWTMTLAGGTVMVVFMLVNRTENLNIFVRCLLGAAVITSIEFGVGMLVNVELGWGVWDYSDKPLNVMGQICPLFSLGWYALSLPAFMLCSAIEKLLSLPKYNS